MSKETDFVLSVSGTPPVPCRLRGGMGHDELDLKAPEEYQSTYTIGVDARASSDTEAKVVIRLHESRRSAH